MSDTPSQRAAAAIAEHIRELLRDKERVLVAIDGRTTAGKTTISRELQRLIPESNVVHMDDFYLHPEQRTEERYAQPGGNVDYERVRSEVIDPWLKTGEFSYAPYDAHEDRCGETIYFTAQPVTIVEGAYSLHPALTDAYDLRVFATIDAAEQVQRVLRRNGAQALEMFRSKWIPLEELYIRETDARGRSNLVFEM